MKQSETELCDPPLPPPLFTQQAELKAEDTATASGGLRDGNRSVNQSVWFQRHRFSDSRFMNDAKQTGPERLNTQRSSKGFSLHIYQDVNLESLRSS